MVHRFEIKSYHVSCTANRNQVKYSPQHAWVVVSIFFLFWHYINNYFFLLLYILKIPQRRFPSLFSGKKCQLVGFYLRLILPSHRLLEPDKRLPRSFYIT
jgi:hypothetical protein